MCPQVNQPPVTPTLALKGTFVSVSTSTATVQLTIEKDVYVYCAASKSVLTAADITGKGVFVRANGNTVLVTVSGLIPLTNYNVYCTTTSIDHVSYGRVLYIPARTICCKLIQVSLIINSIRAGTYQKGFLSVTLSHPPSDYIAVSITTNCTVLSILPNNTYWANNTINLKSYFDIQSNTAKTCVINTVFSGNSVDEYVVEYTLAPMIVSVYPAAAPPPVPKISSAKFNSDGSQVVLYFDSSTDQGQFVNSFTCSALVSFVGVSNSRCSWGDDKTMIIYPSIDVVIGTKVTFKNNQIRAKCVSGVALPCQAWVAVNGSVLVAVPDVISKPTVSILAPSAVSSCVDITLDLTSSFGNGGRVWASLNFDVVVTSSITSQVVVDNSTIALLNYLNNSYIFSPPSVIPYTYFTSGYQYTITATLCNFLEGCGTGSAYISIISNPVPVVTIAGTNPHLIYVKDELVLSASAYLKTCSGFSASSNLIYKWNVLESGVWSRTDIQSNSINPAVLKLSRYTLQSNTWYDVQVSVINKMYNQSVALADARVTVLIGNLVPIILGGSNIGIKLGSSLQLDSSNSYDEDVYNMFGSNLQVNYDWICASTFPTYSLVCPYSLSVVAN